MRRPKNKREHPRGCRQTIAIAANVQWSRPWTSVEVATVVLIWTCFWAAVLLFSVHRNRLEQNEPQKTVSQFSHQNKAYFEARIALEETKINFEALKFMQSLFDQHMTHLELKRNVGGNILRRDEEMVLWAQLSHMSYINKETPTICEIGFAYGFSAVAILTQHPTVKYVGFDVGHASLDATWDIVHGAFPDRTQLIKGSSHETIKKLADMDTDIVCDAWIIDADHSYVGAKQDLLDIEATADKLSSPNPLILWDDCDLEGAANAKEWPTGGIHNCGSTDSCKGPTKAFTESVIEGRIEHIEHGNEIDSHGKFAGWCLSKLNKQLE